MVQPTKSLNQGMDASFLTDISDFIKLHKGLCIGTLGVAILFCGIGNLICRVVIAIGKCFGTTKKVDELKSNIPSNSAINGKGLAPAAKLSYDKKPTADETNKIDEIISSTGSCNLLSLGMKQKKLEVLGAELESLHPLRFFSTIITTPKLKKELINIKGRSQVWPTFFERNSNKLKVQADQDNLLCYMDQFAKDLKLDSVNLTNLAKNNRWKEFFEKIMA